MCSSDLYLRHLLDKSFDLLHQQVVAIRASNLCKILIELSWNKGCLHLKKYFLPVIGHNMCILDSSEKWKVLMAHMHLQLAAHLLTWRILFKNALLREIFRLMPKVACKEPKD